MKYEIKKCLNCCKDFKALIREIKRGNGKFCTLQCSTIYNGKVREKPQPNVECAWCNILIYRNPSKKSLSKSGLYFCTTQHKNAAQAIDGLKEMHLPNYGTGKQNYRNKVFKIANKPKICERCDFSNEAAIVVHHKDYNHDNNDISNLEVLCFNCHAIEHWGNLSQ